MLRRALTQVFCRSPATPHTVLPWALLALALTVGAPGAGGARAQDAAAPVFELPVNCAVGHICHVQNYFDTDPAAGASDYTCGVLTYDGHNGIDIRVPNLVWMARGVTVIAAAAGRVRGVRDGVKDVNIKVAGAEAVRGRECANGVVIDHPGGWETQYCHMMEGSIVVAAGTEVHTGEPLGLIGLSGLTEFPHVHFQVRLRGTAIDPLTGAAAGATCGEGGAPLFSAAAMQDLAYRPTGLLNAGFTAAAPTGRDVLAGEHQSPTLAAQSAALVFWVEVYGARDGDREHFRITAPDGRVLLDAEKKGPDRHKASRLTFMGKRLTADAWPLGVYNGEFVLERMPDGAWQPIVEVRRGSLVAAAPYAKCLGPQGGPPLMRRARAGVDRLVRCRERQMAWPKAARRPAAYAARSRRRGPLGPLP